MDLPVSPWIRILPLVLATWLALLLALIASPTAMVSATEPDPGPNAGSDDPTSVFQPFDGAGSLGDRSGLASTASAVNLCFTSTGPGRQIGVEYVNGVADSVWAGIFNVTMDGVDQKAFCTDIHNDISRICYANSRVGVTDPLVACTLRHYPPSSGLNSGEAAARQAAVWHFADTITVTAPADVRLRYLDIVEDIVRKDALGDCEPVDNVQLSITPSAAVNFLIPDGEGGFEPSRHPFTIRLYSGTRPVAGHEITVTTNLGTLYAGGQPGGPSQVVQTGLDGTAVVTVNHDLAGTALLTATTALTLPVGTRIDPGPEIQKIVLSGSERFPFVATASQQWEEGAQLVVRKFHDRNRDGLFNDSDEMIDWEVTYCESGTDDCTALTLGEDGTETIGIAPQKRYDVCEVADPGWQATTPICYQDVAPPATLWFGNVRLPALLIQKFHDLDGSGQWEPGEPPLDGWNFQVDRQQNGQWVQDRSGVTANGGLLGFADLPLNTYRIQEQFPALEDWRPSTGVSQTLAIQESRLYTATFGNFQPSTLILHKNWQGDAGRIARVCLSRIGPGVLDQPLTPVDGSDRPLQADASGEFCQTISQSVTWRNLWPGDYRVRETELPAGWSGFPTFQQALLSGQVVTVTVTNQQLTTSLGGTVWRDANGNGIRDPGEGGIGGVVVHLFQDVVSPDTPPLQETTTLTQPSGSKPVGWYEFSVSGTGTVYIHIPGANFGPNRPLEELALTGSPAGAPTVPVQLPVPGGRDDIDFGFARPGVDLEKRTNGQDAEFPPGPQILAGAPVSWTYLVVNDGEVPLAGVTVSDDQGVAVSCPRTELDVGESMTCTGSDTAVAGLYRNMGTATGTFAAITVEDSDTSHYTGTDALLEVEKYTNGQDADQPPGPAIRAGTAVTWTYVVTNTGNVPLAGVTVTDDQGVAVSCPRTELDVGESMACSAGGTGQMGQYRNVGTATGTSPTGSLVTASDTSHYFGVRPAISVQKNLLPAGGAVDGILTLAGSDEFRFTVVVSNMGNTPLVEIPLEDRYDPEYLAFAGAEPEPDVVAGGVLTWSNLVANRVLSPGEQLTVTVRFLPAASTDGLAGKQTANRAAVAGARDENGIASEPAEDGASIRITDPGVELQKIIADPANGIVPLGERVVFTIRVRNPGDTTLVKVPVYDLFEADALVFLATSISRPEDNTSGAAGRLFWPDITDDLGDLAPGQSVEFTATFRLIANRETTNLAEVRDVEDEHGDVLPPVTGTAAADVLPGPPPDLYLPMISNPAPLPASTPSPTPTPEADPGGAGDEEPCPPPGCPLPGVFHPKGIAVHRRLNALFVTSRDTDELTKLDLGTNQIVARVSTGDEPWDVVVHEATDRVYVGNFAGGDVWVYDATSLDVVAKIGVGPNPALMDILPNLDTVAVVVRGLNGVALIEGLEVRSYLGAGGRGTYGIAADPEEQYVVVTNRDTGNAWVFYRQDGRWLVGSELKFGPSGGQRVAFAAAVHPNSHKIYVVYTVPGSRWYVDVFDGQSPDRVVKLATVEIGNSGRADSAGVGGTGLAVNPATGNVFVANTADGTVTVLDGTTDQVKATVPVGPDPYTLTVNPDNQTIYITLRSTNRIQKILDNY